MNGALETLMLAAHGADAINNHTCLLFINAQYHAGADAIHNITAVQYYYPSSKTLLDRGYNCFKDINSIERVSFGTTLVLLSKHITQTRHDIAQAIHHTQDNGHIIIAAANNAGGKRLQKLLNEFKIQNVSYISKNKAKAAVFKKGIFDTDTVNSAIKAGQTQFLDTINAHTQAGVYGWNKIDAGSRLLIENTPQQGLHGHIADFGCGYGYLTQYIMNNKNIKSLTCIDADARAVAVCRTNTAHSIMPVRYIWDDLTAPDNLPKNLDFILMNPPFHSGKTADIGIGLGFIKNSARALKAGGILYMVANTHLPYEHLLSDVFSTVENIIQKDGFKVFKAVK